MTAPDTQVFEVDETAGYPNSSLPVLIYRRIFEPSSSALAERFETLFAAHGWVPEWRYGLFAFDHFHSTAHEALGVFRGSARVRLGGPAGGMFLIEAGDALVLPAGVAHAGVEVESDFSMVGAYPPGQTWAVERGDPGGLAAVQARVAAVSRPPDDPVGGSLNVLWLL
ncbi:cupin [Salinicola avicenniae]|uniref:cupin n=1 Tax=Salinicola avicenniae TaxID=2916836 RepID=UPI00207443E6|nr:MULTISPECIES: cupin [unclassified Salinicola]